MEISGSLEAELSLDIEVNNLSVRGKLQKVNSSTFAQEDTVTKEVEIVGDGVSKYHFVYSDLYRTGIAVVEKKQKTE